MLGLLAEDLFQNAEDEADQSLEGLNRFLYFAGLFELLSLLLDLQVQLHLIHILQDHFFGQLEDFLQLFEVERGLELLLFLSRLVDEACDVFEEVGQRDLSLESNRLEKVP